MMIMNSTNMFGCHDCISFTESLFKILDHRDTHLRAPRILDPLIRLQTSTLAKFSENDPARSMEHGLHKRRREPSTTSRPENACNGDPSERHDALSES